MATPWEAKRKKWYKTILDNPSAQDVNIIVANERGALRDFIEELGLEQMEGVKQACEERGLYL